MTVMELVVVNKGYSIAEVDSAEMEAELAEAVAALGIPFPAEDCVLSLMEYATVTRHQTGFIGFPWTLIALRNSDLVSRNNHFTVAIHCRRRSKNLTFLIGKSRNE